MQKIVSIEGIDGAGKTTIVKSLLEIYGPKCVIYRRTQKGTIMSKLLSLNCIAKNHLLQIPLYLLLSHVNYSKVKKQLSTASLIIMDRCFLSNICYFYPNALDNKIALKIATLFEPPIFPQKIFILDVKPEVAQKRDGFKKQLSWLQRTNDEYIRSMHSPLLKEFGIEIICDKYSIQEKVELITRYILQM